MPIKQIDTYKEFAVTTISSLLFCNVCFFILKNFVVRFLLMNSIQQQMVPVCFGWIQFGACGIIGMLFRKIRKLKFDGMQRAIFLVISLIIVAFIHTEGFMWLFNNVGVVIYQKSGLDFFLDYYDFLSFAVGIAMAFVI